ncbi:MAG TPA: helix-turn-helix domain-containing protein [bacterium]|nr:helix-turn-helix domain-containing protein [bacterium]
MEKEYISVSELAKILQISRQAVIKKINNGQVKAIKVGRNYVISKKECLQQKISEKTKQEIKKGVKKVINEYGEVLKLLGKE